MKKYSRNIFYVLHLIFIIVIIITFIFTSQFHHCIHNNFCIICIPASTIAIILILALVIALVVLAIGFWSVFRNHLHKKSARKDGFSGGHQAVLTATNTNSKYCHITSQSAAKYCSYRDKTTQPLTAPVERTVGGRNMSGSVEGMLDMKCSVGRKLDTKCRVSSRDRSGSAEGILDAKGLAGDASDRTSSRRTGSNGLSSAWGYNDEVTLTGGRTDRSESVGDIVDDIHGWEDGELTPWDSDYGSQSYSSMRHFASAPTHTIHNGSNKSTVSKNVNNNSQNTTHIVTS